MNCFPPKPLLTRHEISLLRAGLTADVLSVEQARAWRKVVEQAHKVARLIDQFYAITGELNIAA
jgi:hypothetical protein